MFLTPEQIDHVVKEMSSRAEEYSHLEILDKMSDGAKEDLKANPDLKQKLDSLVQDAFLEGVAQTMFYMAALFERRVHGDRA